MASHTQPPLSGDVLTEATQPDTAADVNRRRFLTGVGMLSAALAGAAAAGCGTTTPFVTAATKADVDVFNYLLNLEYLQATLYSYLITGKDLDGQYTGGGPAPTGAPAQITFPFPQIADLYAEILFDQISHVAALRSVAGTLAVARPQINLAGIAAVDGTNYVQIVRLLEDVGVTAYAGVVGTLSAAINTTGVAQLMAAEGFHAGAVRLLAVQGGLAYPSTLAGYVPPDGFDVRPGDPGTVTLALAGPTLAKGGFFATQAIGTSGQNGTYNGTPFQRSPSQVLAILYGSATAGTAKGGFFPSGVNGNLKAV